VRIILNTNTLCEQNVELMLQQAMHVVTTVLLIANALMPNGHYMYHHFNIQQFYVLPTQCIYVFCVDLRKTAISLYSSN